MLNLWRRHTTTCLKRLQKKGVRNFRSHKDCSCPVWVQGSLHGEWMKKSLGIRNWESAQRLVRDWEAGSGDQTVPMKEACDRFYSDCEARNLGPAQLGKYGLLIRELKGWFPDRVVASVGVDDLRGYRESWNLSPISASKKLERVRTFFRFCMESGWIGSNPARVLKAPKVKPTPTLPFSDEEMEKILWATEIYPDRPKGRRDQVKAFVLILRHAGLRIRDAVCLKRVAVAEGRVFLYTAKTGAPVYVPIPEDAVAHIKLLMGGGEYFFWSGNGEPKSAVADWQRTLAKLFKLAGVKGHAHRFRDNFAVGLLTRGVSLEIVSILLGHSDIRITQKHYAPWVKARQDSLERAVKATWG